MVLEERYESPLSIDTKQAQSSFHLRQSHENLDFTGLDENRQNFTFSPKILGICDFDEGFG